MNINKYGNNKKSMIGQRQTSDYKTGCRLHSTELLCLNLGVGYGGRDKSSIEHAPIILDNKTKFK